MAYIGKQPTVGNFVKLDAITTSATATYNLTNGGVAYFPQTANNCIVSLNGVIQEPTSASNVGGFTISGSTIIFTSALTSADVIDFILVLGDVLNIGTPSDGTVGFAKVTSNLITGATAETTIAGGDSVLIYDDSASALRKMTRTNFISGLANTPAFLVTRTSASQTIANNTETKVQFTDEIYDTNNCFDSSTNYRFTPTTAGKYFFNATLSIYGTSAAWQDFEFSIKKNNSTYLAFSLILQNTGNQFEFTVATVSAFDDANGSTDYYECFVKYNYTSGSGSNIIDNSRHNINFGGFKLIT